jgi:4-hydroxy-4-methyl-2-oxoglutarate aldolase
MKKRFLLLLAAVTTFYCIDSFAQNGEEVSDEVLPELYRGARVTDVVDGLVTVG